MYGTGGIRERRLRLIQRNDPQWVFQVLPILLIVIKSSLVSDLSR
jgi:hypothetical protein